MSNRLDRARRIARLAEVDELTARGVFAEQNRLVNDAVRSIDDVRDRAMAMAGDPMSPALRSMLAQSGARNMAVMTDHRIELERDLDARRGTWNAARTRARAMRKLVERIEAEQRGVRTRAEGLAWQDLVAARSAVRA